MHFLIINLLILCALFFTGCSTEKKELEETQALTLWQEALYFHREGAFSLAEEKAQLALNVAQTTPLKAEITLFLTGDASLLDELAEGAKKRTLLGDHFVQQCAYEEALASYEKALTYMESTLSELYDVRTTTNPKSLAVYKQRLAMRHVQLKIAECLDILGRDNDAAFMLRRVSLSASWQDVRAKYQKLEGKPLDTSLYASDHIGHTAAQFAHLTESEERYLLKSSLELASKKGSSQ